MIPRLRTVERDSARLTVELVDAGRHAPPSGWDAAVTALGLSAAWHSQPVRAFARFAPEVVLLGVVRSGPDVIAMACFRSRRWRPSADPRRLDRTPRALGWRCRVPVSFESGLAFAAGSSLEDRYRIRKLLEGAVARHGRGGACVILHDSIPPSRWDEFASARLVLEQSPTARFVNEFSSFDEYLAGLPRSRRRKFRGALAAAESDHGLDLFEASPIDGTQASRLDLLTRSRHGSRRSRVVPLPPEYFDALTATGRAGYFGTRRADGELLQFDAVLESAGPLLATVTGGADRRAAGGLYTLLFLQEIRFVIEKGLPGIDVGPGSLEPKLRVGCRTEGRRAFLSLVAGRS